MVNENRDCQPVLFIVYQETATKRNTKISLLNSCAYTFHAQTSDKILLQTEEVSFSNLSLLLLVLLGRSSCLFNFETFSIVVRAKMKSI